MPPCPLQLAFTMKLCSENDTSPEAIQIAPPSNPARTFLIELFRNMRNPAFIITAPQDRNATASAIKLPLVKSTVPPTSLSAPAS
eukprot:3713190-Prymnesium_polylepis.2